MKKYLWCFALVVLLAALAWAHMAETTNQAMLAQYYHMLMPEAESFQPLDGKTAIALDAAGKTIGYAGVSSHVGYGGPMIVGVAVGLDGSLGTPVLFSHKETPAYLDKIRQQGFFDQFAKKRADDALAPGYDIDAVSGATLSSRAVAYSVSKAAHGIAERALGLAPKKAVLPWQAGAAEMAVAGLFALSLMALQIKRLAKLRLVLLGLSVIILGFWLNRSFSLAYVISACLGFFPDVAQNLLWYIVVLGALLPAVVLGKNIYCTFVCPFCGVQELTHKISSLNLPAEAVLKRVRPLRQVLLFIALLVGFLSINPSSAGYEPFGVIFGLNGESYSWYLLFIMLVASFFFHRFWCHVFCPAGALLDFVAARRRDAGKLWRCKKACATCTAAPKQNTSLAAAPRVKITQSQLLFLVFYVVGLVSIALTVRSNLEI